MRRNLSTELSVLPQSFFGPNTRPEFRAPVSIQLGDWAGCRRRSAFFATFPWMHKGLGANGHGAESFVKQDQNATAVLQNGANHRPEPSDRDPTNQRTSILNLSRPPQRYATRARHLGPSGREGLQYLRRPQTRSGHDISPNRLALVQ